MLYSLDKLTTVKLMSSDSAYADIKDFYFDDAGWTVRYFVADLGTWLSERLVLISPQALSDYSEEKKAFHTNGGLGVMW
ncbi:MAG: PRC-barrel domain-containing protein [Pseudobdellovibrionaceae bacterium]|nr:PRC-barrel domain-containing protein [Pseudobdellovibrionaceae bacterium]